MARRTRHRAVGLSASINYQEICNLKLAAEHFPISCSLRMQLEQAIAKGSRKGNDPIMPVDDLLAYLRAPADLDLTPYADLLNQTEAMGDPALPSWEHTVILRWLGEAWHFYEQRFPLEEPLTSTVRRLKPLAATFAIVDPDFMQPDVHALHQLLDSIQERAVGWQASLGRAGANLERQIVTAVDDALSWFDDNSTDLTAICSEFLQAAERDNNRARRMSQRVIDTELGKQKTANAKTTAANMINSALEKQDTPSELAGFIKGPWYESAQLLLLKFGESSDEWRKMCRTTEILLDSMQSLEGVSEDRRQHVFSVVTKLPKELRRWLLSLHHDTDAVNEAIGQLESLHVSLLKNEDLQHGKQGPIPTAVTDSLDANSPLVKAMSPLQESQWFAIRNFKGSTIRVQLALKNAATQRMIFTNLAGMAVAHYSFEEFDQIMRKKHVMALPARGGFSLCLALASGVDTVEKLNALYATIAGVAPIDENDPNADEGLTDTSADTSQSDGSAAENPATELNQDTSAAGASSAAHAIDSTSGGIDSNGESDDELTAEFLDAVLSAEPSQEEDTPDINAANADISDAPDKAGVSSSATTEGGTAGPASGASDELQDGWLSNAAAEKAADPMEGDFLGALEDGTDMNGETAESSFQDNAVPGDPFEDDSSQSRDDSYFGDADLADDFLSEAPPAPKDNAPLQPTENLQAPQSAPQNISPETANVEAEVKSIEDIGYFGAKTSDMQDVGFDGAPINDASTPAADPSPGTATQPANLDLAMGVWLGFHDGETPMMAKLAVHDLSSDLYIFVNRNGIKLRELSGETLTTLLRSGMAEVLLTSSKP